MSSASGKRLTSEEKKRRRAKRRKMGLAARRQTRPRVVNGGYREIDSTLADHICKFFVDNRRPDDVRSHLPRRSPFRTPKKRSWGVINYKHLISFRNGPTDTTIGVFNLEFENDTVVVRAFLNLRSKEYMGVLSDPDLIPKLDRFLEILFEDYHITVAANRAS